MNDTKKEYNGKNTQTNNVLYHTIRLGRSWNFVTLNSRVVEGEVVREEKTNKYFLEGCPIREVFLRERLPHGCPFKLKMFTCRDGTVTLTFNLTQLFYFQNISFSFSANKRKHTTSDHKKGRGRSLNFHFQGRVHL